MKHPLFKILIFLILGIYCEITLGVFKKEFHLIIIFNLLLLVFFEKVLHNSSYIKKYLLELILAFSFVVSGVILVDFKNDSSYLNYIGNSKDILESKKDFETNLEIYQPIFISQKSIKIKCEVISIQINSTIEKHIGKVIIYLPKDSSSIKLLPGDKISVNCFFNKLTNPKNPHQFNYSKFLKTKQIEYTGYVSNWTFIGSSWTLKRFSTIARNRCLKSFSDCGLKSNEFAIASALTFGYKDELSQFVKGIFSKTGAMHILAVSGLHVGIVFLIISTFFKFFKMSYRYKKIQQLILIFFVWLYAVLTGLSPSVLRAATMLTFFSIAEIFNKSTNIYNILASSAIFLLVIDPFLINNVGFQLSFFAVAGIIYLYPIIFNSLIINNYILKKIWTISSVSIAAQIATFPLSIFYFHQFPNFFLLSNLLVIPLVSILLIIGLSIIVFNFLPCVSIFLGKILNIIISFIVKALSIIESIPYSLSDRLYISVFETVMIYLLIILILCKLRFNIKFLNFLIVIHGIFILLLDFSEDQERLNKSSIIFYSIPNHIAIDLIEGKNHFFIADKKLLENKKLINNHIRNNWDFNDLRNPKILCYDSLISKSIIWQNKSIGYVNEKWNSSSNLDFAIIDKDFLLKNLANLQNSKTVFIIANNLFNTKNKINIQSLSKISSSIHDLSKSGAYIHRF